MIERADKLNNQAILLANDGAFTEAIACFKRALTLQKDNYLLWFNLGVTYRDSGNLKEAKNALEMAYKISPENEDIAETLASICIADNQLTQAQEIATAYLDYNPYHPHFWNLLGVVSFQSEDYGSASEYFEHAVYINPYYEDAILNLKDTYSLLNLKSGQEECDRLLKSLDKKR